jgi:hypothetical protein
MDACWASCLGGCSNKITREHLVSAALFLDNQIRVEGLPWCKGEPVQIGLSNLTSKILCKKHNSDLSGIDTAGGNAFDAFRQMRGLCNVREKWPDRRWSLFRYKVDGVGFERWCLKTLINLCCNRERPIGRDSTIAGRPSDRLVRIAYGLEPFPEKAGLYFAARVGMNIKSEDRVSFASLSSQAGNIEGGLFSFRGPLLVLWLEVGGPPAALAGVSIDGENLANAELKYHLKRIAVKMGRYVSQIMTFSW